MSKIIVLGCGLVGKVIAEDLSQEHNVTSCEAFVLYIGSIVLLGGEPMGKSLCWLGQISCTHISPSPSKFGSSGCWFPTYQTLPSSSKNKSY